VVFDVGDEDESSDHVVVEESTFTVDGVEDDNGHATFNHS
jgi:hypothetical protein